MNLGKNDRLVLLNVAKDIAYWRDRYARGDFVHKTDSHYHADFARESIVRLDVAGWFGTDSQSARTLASRAITKLINHGLLTKPFGRKSPWLQLTESGEKLAGKCSPTPLRHNPDV